MRIFYRIQNVSQDTTSEQFINTRAPTVSRVNRVTKNSNRLKTLNRAQLHLLEHQSVLRIQRDIFLEIWEFEHLFQNGNWFQNLKYENLMNVLAMTGSNFGWVMMDLLSRCVSYCLSSSLESAYCGRLASESAIVVLAPSPYTSQSNSVA